MCDPTDHIQTLEGAIVLASAMLSTPAVQSHAGPSVNPWKAVSEPVLAALLYTASPCQRGGGMTWVNNAVSALAANIGHPGDVIGLRHPLGRRFMNSLTSMEGRAQDTVLLTIRDAVLPWVAA